MHHLDPFSKSCIFLWPSYILFSFEIRHKKRRHKWSRVTDDTFVKNAGSRHLSVLLSSTFATPPHFWNAILRGRHRLEFRSPSFIVFGVGEGMSLCTCIRWQIGYKRPRPTIFSESTITRCEFDSLGRTIAGFVFCPC